MRASSQGPKTVTKGVKTAAGRRGDQRWDAAAVANARRPARTRERHLTDARQTFVKRSEDQLEAVKPKAQQQGSSEERFTRICSARGPAAHAIELPGFLRTQTAANKQASLPSESQARTRATPRHSSTLQARHVEPELKRFSVFEIADPARDWVRIRHGTGYGSAGTGRTFILQKWRQCPARTDANQEAPRRDIRT